MARFLSGVPCLLKMPHAFADVNLLMAACLMCWSSLVSLLHSVIMSSRSKEMFFSRSCRTMRSMKIAMGSVGSSSNVKFQSSGPSSVGCIVKG